jgi:ABC-type polar amino acid transport system ATPase subunit
MAHPNVLKPAPLKTGVAVDMVGVHKWYGDFHVLRDINMEVAKGERIVICGPSGSGKSTLIRCINALERLDGGKITVDGFNVSVPRELAEARKRSGTVFQLFNLYPHMTVLRNITLAPIEVLKRPRAEAEAEGRALLASVGLAERADAYPAQLSGGQRQRVAIIQQLLCGHTYLLMDEPFSGLDPINKQAACELIAEVSRMDERNTIILVTHDIREAVKVSDTLWLMGREVTPSGEPIAGSRIVEIYNLIERDLAWHPGIERTAEFEAFVRELEDRFRTL